MSKKESNPSSKRRDALRKLAITGGVIGTARTWSKPVVDSVVLPAHALTSDPLRDPCTNVKVLAGTDGPYTYSVQLSGLVEGNPDEVGGIPIHIDVTSSLGTSKSVDTVTNSSGHYGPVVIGPFDVCSDGPTGNITVSSSAFSGTTSCPYNSAKTCPG